MNHIIQHFKYKHLNFDAPEIIEPFTTLANHLDALLDEGPEKTVALRKLLESCDQAIRSRMLDVQNHIRDERINEVKDQLYPNHQQEDVNG